MSAPDAPDAAREVVVAGRRVRGLGLDAQGRCAHWRGPTDVVAIRMACCHTYYACIDCHTALAGHAAQPWPATAGAEPAVLCGACGHEMAIAAYLSSGSQCPACAHPFNPGCARHYPHYFTLPLSGPAPQP